MPNGKIRLISHQVKAKRLQNNQQDTITFESNKIKKTQKVRLASIEMNHNHLWKNRRLFVSVQFSTVTKEIF